MKFAGGPSDPPERSERRRAQHGGVPERSPRDEGGRMMPSGERLRANAWGRYYVTDECDACGLCEEYAPDVFAPAWDGTYYAIAAQPVGVIEERAVWDAMAVCPRQCIKEDGDE
jgi:ferredoxin